MNVCLYVQVFSTISVFLTPYHPRLKPSISLIWVISVLISKVVHKGALRNLSTPRSESLWRFSVILAEQKFAKVKIVVKMINKIFQNEGTRVVKWYEAGILSQQPGFNSHLGKNHKKIIKNHLVSFYNDCELQGGYLKKRHKTHPVIETLSTFLQ